MFALLTLADPPVSGCVNGEGYHVRITGGALPLVRDARLAVARLPDKSERLLWQLIVQNQPQLQSLDQRLSRDEEYTRGQERL